MKGFEQPLWHSYRGASLISSRGLAVGCIVGVEVVPVVGEESSPAREDGEVDDKSTKLEDGVLGTCRGAVEAVGLLRKRCVCEVGENCSWCNKGIEVLFISRPTAVEDWSLTSAVNKSPDSIDPNIVSASQICPKSSAEGSARNNVAAPLRLSLGGSGVDMMSRKEL